MLKICRTTMDRFLSDSLKGLASYDIVGVVPESKFLREKFEATCLKCKLNDNDFFYMINGADLDFFNIKDAEHLRLEIDEPH